MEVAGDYDDHREKSDGGKSEYVQDQLSKERIHAGKLGPLTMIFPTGRTFVASFWRTRT